MMARKAPICKKCGQRPATGPDRETDLNWRRSICDQCRMGYMRGDVQAILAVEAKRRVKTGDAA